MARSTQQKDSLRFQHGTLIHAMYVEKRRNAQSREIFIILTSPDMTEPKDIVVDEDTARRLRDAGYPQDKSYFVWYEGRAIARQSIVYLERTIGKQEFMAAPTAQEMVIREHNLGEEEADIWTTLKRFGII